MPHPLSPGHVTVYGNDHSPWVQAVLLALHDAEIAYTLIAAPPLELLPQGGVLMPAVRFDHGPWRYDSGDVLEALGCGAVAPDRAKALGGLFLRSAMTRVDQRWRFWKRFSLSRDGDPDPWRRAWHNVARAFPVFYFFLLINGGRRRAPRSDADGYARRFGELQDWLAEDAAFFHGERPGTFDFQLFGLVQMLETMPTLPLEVLCEHPGLGRLRRWIAVMQERFSDYDRLYTAQRFEPRSPERPVASPFERTLFWTGAALCWLAAPLTVPLVLFLVVRVRRNGLLQEAAPAPDEAAA